MLTGEYDHLTTPEDGRRTAAAIKNASFIEMKEIGHFPMSENYPAFRTDLAEPSTPSPPPPRRSSSEVGRTVDVKDRPGAPCGLRRGGVHHGGGDLPGCRDRFVDDAPRLARFGQVTP